MEVLRVKRKRGADPAEALLISCKRLRAENDEKEGDTDQVTREIFRLVATVSSQVGGPSREKDPRQVGGALSPVRELSLVISWVLKTSTELLNPFLTKVHICGVIEVGVSL